MERQVQWLSVTALLHSFAFVHVQPTAHTTVLDDVKLVGGTSPCTGILMKHQEREWRPVADFMSVWSQESSAVVCRQLDCGSAVTTEWNSGSSRQPVWWSKSSCVGSESSLRDCGAMQSGRSWDRLEVFCSDLLFKPVITIEGASVGPVAEGSSFNITIDGVSGGQVAEGSSFTVRCSVRAQYPGGDFRLTFVGPDAMHTYTHRAINHSADFHFLKADPSHRGNYSCVYRIHVFSHVFSSASAPLPLTVKESYAVRLDELGRPCSGVLEMKHHGKWRPVADLTSNWNQGASSVVCRQLDCGDVLSTEWTSGYSRTPVWWIASSCVGSESSLGECGGTIHSSRSWDRLEVSCSG